MRHHCPCWIWMWKSPLDSMWVMLWTGSPHSIRLSGCQKTFCTARPQLLQLELALQGHRSTIPLWLFINAPGLKARIITRLVGFLPTRGLSGRPPRPEAGLGSSWNFSSSPILPHWRREGVLKIWYLISYTKPISTFKTRKQFVLSCALRREFLCFCFPDFNV